MRQAEAALSAPACAMDASLRPPAKPRFCLDCPNTIAGKPTASKRCDACRERRARKNYLIRRLVHRREKRRRFCLDCPKDITSTSGAPKRCEQCRERRLRKQWLIKKLHQQPRHCLDCLEDIAERPAWAKRCRDCQTDRAWRRSVERSRQYSRARDIRNMYLVGERDGWICGRPGGVKGCGKLLRPDDGIEVDHILPRSKGGDDRPKNLQLLCAPCNRLWSAHLEGEARTPVRTIVKSMGGKPDVVVLWLTKREARQLKRASKPSGTACGGVAVEAFLL